MKIQDAVTQNLAYWTEQQGLLERRLGKMQQEVQKIATQLTEAQQQIQLYGKAAELLTTLDQQKVDAMNVQVEG